jgi:glutathione peroxidase-family protein
VRVHPAVRRAGAAARAVRRLRVLGGGFPVNGPGRHPLYAELVETPDADGRAGDVQWNFEKFLVDPAGSVVARFRTRTDPEAPEIVEAIRASLPDRVT